MSSAEELVNFDLEVGMAKEQEHACCLRLIRDWQNAESRVSQLESEKAAEIGKTEEWEELARYQGEVVARLIILLMGANPWPRRIG